MAYRKKNYFLVLFVFITSLALAQSQSHTFSEIDRISKETFINTVLEKTKSSFTDSFKPIKRRKSKYGIQHELMQQYHQGIPVDMSYYLLHSRNGFLIGANGNIVTLKNVSTEATISPEIAFAKALQTINAQKYAWEDEKLKTLFKEKNANSDFFEIPVPLLTYFSDGSSYKLSYKIEINALLPQGHFFVYIDASNGNVLQQIDITNNETAPCETLYYGTQNIDFSEISGGLYELDDNQRNIETYELPNNSIDYSQAILPTSSFIDWNDINEREALDVHWGSAVVYDFWQSKGINSFNNDGADIVSYINYGNNLGSKSNAFWNGAFMTYGAGGANPFPGPVATLDVVAHELGHALTQEFGGGLMYYGESGALNEAYSDMMAAASENFVNTSSNYGNLSLNPWILSDLNGNGIRDMSNPNAFGQPDTYLGDFWADTNGPDNGGVHTNSGVANYWFYLLSEGGSGINDHGTVYNIDEPLGIEAATEIVLEAYNYMLPNSTYADFANATIMATNSLHNNLCGIVERVVEAWTAVGINYIDQDCVLFVALEEPETQVCVNQSEVYTVDSSLYNSSYMYEWFLDGNSLGEVSNSNTSPEVLITEERTHELLVTVLDPSTDRTNATSVNLFGSNCELYNLDKAVMYGDTKVQWQTGDPFTGHIINFQSGRPRSEVFVDDVFRSEVSEGTITQTDEQGNLIFYIARDNPFSSSEPPITYIYDKNGNPIFELEDIKLSIYQIGASIPSPNRDFYTLFINSGHISPTKALYRLRIDVDQDNNVIVNSSTPFIEPVTMPATGYSYATNGGIQVEDDTTVIPGCSENQYWILNIARNSSRLLVYKFEYSTEHPEGLLEVAPTSGQSGFFQFRPFHVSPSGERILSENRIYDFDKTTGQLTFVHQIQSIDDFDDYTHGAFTANERFFYGSKTKNQEERIYRLDMNDFSETLLFSYDSYTNKDLIRGPDNKIYFITRVPGEGHKFLNIINYPESESTAADALGINEEYIYGISNFPRYIEGARPTPTSIDYNWAQNDCNTITFTATVCKPYYTWDFGDGTAPVTQDSNSITHEFPSDGMYTVSVTSDVDGIPQSYEDTIEISELDIVEILGDINTTEQNAVYTTSYVGTSYLWTVISGNVTLSNETTNTVYVSFDGVGDYTLQLEVTDVNGCFITSQIDINYQSLGLEENELFSNIQIYPNPTHSNVTVSNIPDVEFISIYDIRGRLIKKYTVGKSIITLDIDVSLLNNGVYFMEFKNENTFGVRKFIKK